MIMLAVDSVNKIIWRNELNMHSCKDSHICNSCNWYLDNYRSTLLKKNNNKYSHYSVLRIPQNLAQCGKK